MLHLNKVLCLCHAIVRIHLTGKLDVIELRCKWQRHAVRMFSFGQEREAGLQVDGAKSSF